MEQKNRMMYQAEDTIDLLELFFAYLKHWVAILACMIVFGGALGAYCKFIVPPSYRADSSLYITSNNSIVSLSDLQISTALTSDYERIITSRHVLLEVIDNLQMERDYEALKRMITVTNPNGSHIIEIGVVCEDANEAVQIANEVLHVSVEEIYKVIGSSEPSILDQSEAEFVEDVKASTLKYALVGMMLGLVLSCGIITIRVLMDNSLKSEEDVAKYLGLPVLAMVPQNGSKTKSYGYGK